MRGTEPTFLVLEKGFVWRKCQISRKVKFPASVLSTTLISSLLPPSYTILLSPFRLIAHDLKFHNNNRQHKLVPRSIQRPKSTSPNEQHHRYVMAGNAEASSSTGGGERPASGSFKHVGNKMKRTELYRKYKSEKNKAKFSRRSAQAKEERGEDGAAKKAARLAANKTRTIENTRDFNPTIINAPNTHEGPGPSNLKKTAAGKGDDEQGSDDEEDSEAEETQEVQEQEAAEEIDDDEDPSAPPAILITTSMPSSSTSPHLESLNARSILRRKRENSSTNCYLSSLAQNTDLVPKRKVLD